jgi:hypothetical protein
METRIDTADPRTGRSERELAEDGIEAFFRLVPHIVGRFQGQDMGLIIYDPGYLAPPDHLRGESAAGRRVYIRVVDAEREFSVQVDPFIRSCT